MRKIAIAMNIVISHKTAFNIYSNYRLDKNFALIEKFHLILNFKLPELISANEVNSLRNFVNMSWMKGKIDFLVKNKNHCIFNDGIKTHYSKLIYPNNSFYKIKNNIYLVSPELLFYQLSKSINAIDLMLAGYELCGAYTINRNNELSLINGIRPLTSKKKLLSYLQTLKKLNNKCNGFSKAYKIAEQILDNSFSPMESRIATMLCSNRSFGGYGLKNMQLNKPVQLSQAAKKICFKDYVMPDMSNEKIKLAIEYDSDQFHDNINKNQDDKLRLDALHHDKWRVITFVNVTTHNFSSMNQLAIDILKYNKQDTRFSSAKFLQRKYNLYNKLFNNLY